MVQIIDIGRRILLLLGVLSLAACGSSGTTASTTTTTASLPTQVISELSSTLTGSQASTSLGAKQIKATGSTIDNISLDLTTAEITIVIDACTSAINTASLGSSTDLNAIIPEIIAGVATGLASLDTEESELAEAIQLTIGSLAASLNGRESYLPASSAAEGATALETALSRIAEHGVGALEDAGVSVDNIAAYVDDCSAVLGERLDDTGLTKDQLSSALSWVSRGAVSGVNRIPTLAEANLATVISNISAGLTGALDDIAITGVTFEDFDDLVAQIPAGMTQGFNQFTFSYFSVAHVEPMVNAMTAGATGALDAISFTGYDVDFLDDMVGRITEGAIAALDGITVTGFDYTYIDNCSGAISAGATLGLDNISMTGYGVDNLNTMISSISQYAVGALDGIVMTGFDASFMSSVTTAITGQMTNSLDDLTMTGYDVSYLDNMLTAVSQGATAGLGYITYDGFTGDSLQGMASAISQGQTMFLDNLSMTGYDASQLQTMTSAISQGCTLGMTGLGDVYGTGFDSAALFSGFTTGVGLASEGYSGDFAANQDSMDDWLYTGFAVTGAGYVPPPLETLQTSFTEGTSQEWVDPGYTTQWTDYGNPTYTPPTTPTTPTPEPETPPTEPMSQPTPP